MTPICNRVNFPLDTHELAWAAGLMDGEGTIGTYAQAHGGFAVALKVAMTDEESVRRFYRAVGGIGRVGGPYPGGRGKRKPQHRFYASSFEAVQFIVGILWAWLGRQKREQSKKALLFMRGNVKRRSMLHRLTPEEQRIYLRKEAKQRNARWLSKPENQEKRKLYVQRWWQKPETLEKRKAYRRTRSAKHGTSGRQRV